MAEAAQQRAWNIQIAKARVGVDVGGGATLDALRHFKPYAGAGFENLSDEIELGPGRHTVHIDVAAEAQRIDRNADHVLDGGDAGEIDDRHESPAGVREPK